MKLLLLLVLSAYCCQGSPLASQETDCNDPEVFNAVDAALQTFNRERKAGHQFALDVILEASKTEALSGSAHFLVKYEIRETTCAAGGGIPWQNCRFIPTSQADSGICNAQVYWDNTLESFQVSQNCQLIPGSGKVSPIRAGCMGCWHSIATDRLDLLPIVRYTIREFNKQTQHPSLFEVGEIIEAKSQVVAGMNYNFKYLVRETNCSRAEFPDPTPECKLILAGHEELCVVTAHVNLSRTLVYAFQKCQPQVKETVAPPIVSCHGCPKKMDENNEELQKPLQAALDKFNSESNDEFYYEVEMITSATSQIVAGLMYRIHFTIRKTNCSKADFKKPREDCRVAENSERKSCFASVYMIPWQSKVLPNVTCSDLDVLSAPTTLRIFPGFTPFRSARMGTERGLGHVQEPTNIRGKGPGRGHGGRGHGRGHGHHHHKPGKDKDSSSEESKDSSKKKEKVPSVPLATEIPNQLSTLQSFLQEEEPTKSANQDNVVSPAFPSAPLFDSLPNLVAPKCPGKPWTPIVDFPTHATDPDLRLEDLLPSFVGATPEPHEKSLSNNHHPNPGEFNLEEALGY